MATLTINFTVPTPLPYGGFVVKYRPIGGSAYTTVIPNPISSPVTITGLTPGTGYEGSIRSECGNGSQSPEINFVAYASNQVYTLIGTSLPATCLASASPVYLTSAYTDIATGATVYTDAGLTTPLATATHIMATNGTVYTITSSGVVGSVAGTCGE